MTEPDFPPQMVDDNLFPVQIVDAPPKSASGDQSKSADTWSAMSTKSFRPAFKNVGDQGTATFVVATLNEVDKDGDVTLPGFFGKQHVTMVPVHDWNHVPIGKGLLYEDGDEVLCDVKFNLKIPAAKDWYEAVKFDFENPPSLAQYSYGFDVLEGGQKSGYHNGRNVRFLQPKDNGTPGVKVHEVSPVLVGAGSNTRTLAVKSRKGGGMPTRPAPIVRAVKGAIPSHETKTASRPWDNAKTLRMLPPDSLPSELRTVYGWVDPDGDPEELASYKMAHHHGIGGPANVRACLIGIAQLNEGTSGIPESDRKSVYDHLASHLKDADHEPPVLRTDAGAAVKNQRFGDEAAHVLASLSGLIDRASEVMVLRRTKGKGLAANTADLLGWVCDETKRLKHLLENPVEPETPQPDDDEIASVVAASIARLNGIPAA